MSKNFKINYSAEPKIDGISASLTFKGKFYKGLSRGDGKEGEDITENLATINDIPVYFIKDFPEEIDIRGEVFIQNSDFENLKEKFANPRNAASGSLRQKNQKIQKNTMKFIAYTFGYEKGLEVNNQYDFIKKLSEWGFKTNALNKLISGIKDLIKNYHEIEKNNLEFDIDGIVYKVNDFHFKKDWVMLPMLQDGQ